MTSQSFGRCSTGDRDAFRVLVDRESAAVVRACYRVLGDLHEAEDVAQEAFVSAYRVARDVARRRTVRRLADAASRSGWPSGSSAGDARWPGCPRPMPRTPARTPIARAAREPATQPEHVALRAERASATRRAVADLDEPYREVVALRFFGERSLDEIALATGRPLSTVKTHLRRGLLRLRDRVDPRSLT